MISIMSIGKKIVKGTTKSVKDWSGYDGLSKSTRIFHDFTKKLFSVNKISDLDNANFAEVCLAYGITEEMLQKKCRVLKLQCAIFVVFGMLIFLYGCYCLTELQFFSMLMSFLLTTLMLSLAFRAHFWLFQILQKKLGCTFKEWAAAVFSGEKL